MLSLLYGQDKIVVPWICALLKMQPPMNCVSIGVLKDGGIIGAALFHNYNLTADGRPLFIEMSFGTIDKRWANRAIITALLGYPFSQLKVKRVQSTVSRKNRAVRLFLERLGFKLEGVGRQAWPHGGDALMYSLLSGEFFTSCWSDKRGKILSICPDTARSNNNSQRANGQQSANGAVPVRAEQSKHHNAAGQPAIHNGLIQPGYAANERTRNSLSG